MGAGAVKGVSGDLLVKLALGVAVLVAGYVMYRKAADVVSETAGSIADTVREAGSAAVDAVNPASQTNIVNRGVNAVGEAISGRPGWNLGGWIYDVTH